VELAYRTATLRLAEPFTISRSTSLEEEVVWVELAHDGSSGFGEAQPQGHYGESVEGASAFLDEARALLGDDPFALEAIGSRLAELPGNAAAKAALDAALHDLCGKLTGLPVWRLFGLARAGPPSSWTIGLGDPDEMARKAERTSGFTGLKLKLGARDGHDVERVPGGRASRWRPCGSDCSDRPPREWWCEASRFPFVRMNLRDQTTQSEDPAELRLG
jgi:L-Ala-D/L-Glu epimerase